MRVRAVSTGLDGLIPLCLPPPPSRFSFCHRHRVSEARHMRNAAQPHPIPYTLLLSHTLYPIPYTLYPIPYTLYPIPYTLYCTYALSRQQDAAKQRGARTLLSDRGGHGICPPLGGCALRGVRRHAPPRPPIHPPKNFRDLTLRSSRPGQPIL